LFNVTNSILGDLQAGEIPVMFNDLPRHRLTPKKNGKPLHLSCFYRWKGKGLETLKTPTGLIVTESAILRFFARLSGAQPSTVQRSSARREKSISKAERELEAAGL
jgi:hypothetical protein